MSENNVVRNDLLPLTPEILITLLDPDTHLELLDQGFQPQVTYLTDAQNGSAELFFCLFPPGTAVRDILDVKPDASLITVKTREGRIRGTLEPVKLNLEQARAVRSAIESAQQSLLKQPLLAKEPALKDTPYEPRRNRKLL